MDEMQVLADLGHTLEREPPATLARQRNRLLGALEDAAAGNADRRGRRRPLFAVGAAALVATAACVLILPSHHDAPVASHPASHPSTTALALAGWSVQSQSDGDVEVTLKQLTDATALREALASAKVPARVWLVPTSVPDPKTFAALSAPIVGCPVDYTQMKRIEQATGIVGISFPNTAARDLVFTIDPSVLPENTVVNIVLYTLHGAEAGYYISVSEVTANACTPFQQ